jgi:hypothetical protein
MPSVRTSNYLLDIVELSSADDHTLEVPWHFSGTVEIESAQPWTSAELGDEFVKRPEQIDVAGPEALVIRACGRSGANLRAHLLFDGQLIRAMAPGVPGSSEAAPLYVARARGENPRTITVLEPSSDQLRVKQLTLTDEGIEVKTDTGVDHHAVTVEGWEIRTNSGAVRLAGPRRQVKPFQPLIRHDRPVPPYAIALPLAEPPALDGSLDGFDTGDPIQLDHEDQYRRSEESYPGPEEFSATGILNWSDDALYLAVEVTKPDIFAHDTSSAPLFLDNEPDEIHADGIQVYLEIEEKTHGYLIVPSTSDGELIVRGVAGARLGPTEVRGRWGLTEGGFRITVALAPPGWGPFRPGDELGFDLIINQMLPDRQRRAGQLVWTGGGGWVWLRGDGQDPAAFGRLELR